MADNQKMIQNLFAGMQSALFLGDPLARSEFVSFMQPGQFLSTELRQDDTSPDMFLVSDLANAVVDTTYVTPYDEVSADGTRFIYRELLGSVDQVYRDVLVRAALPHTALDPDTLMELEAIRAWIIANEPNYSLYRERYFDAVQAYDVEANSQNPDSGRLRRLAAARDQAHRNWDVLGRRGQFESKYGRFMYLSAPDPATVWADLRLQMDAQSRQTTSGQQYYQTFLNPAPAAWNSPSTSWAHYERTINDSETFDYSRQTSWSGGIGARWGLWSFGGGASGSTNLQRSRSEVSTVHIAFDYLRVRIVRPWMRPDVLSYRFWTWRKDFGGQLLSDGGNLHVTPPVRPIGRMPVLPTHFVVVRNVQLSAAFSQQERELFERTVRYRASGGWGPFSVSGSYTESTRTLYTKASFDGTTFRIDQPQIIARTGIILPKSPNPDPSLPWQDDESFHADEAAAKGIQARRHEDYRAMVANEQLDDYRQGLASLSDRLLAKKIGDLEALTGSSKGGDDARA